MVNQKSGAEQNKGFYVRAPQRLIVGVTLVCVCFFVLWAVANLNQGTIRMMGPAMVPRSLAIALGVCGVSFILVSFLVDGPPLETIAYRGPAMVTLSILLFAMTIRPFGLAVAGILTLIVSGFATAEARPREVIIFSISITFACIILFRYLLDMSVTVLAIPGTGIGF